MTHAIIDATDGTRLFCRLFEPEESPRATLCIVHGFGEHSGRYIHVAKALIAQGIAVVALDVRGYGKSPGKRGCTPSYAMFMDDIGSMLVAAQTRWPSVPLFLYGHSMGGNLALNYVLRRDPPLAGVIVSSPWLRLTHPKSFALDLFAGIMARILPRYTQLAKNNPKAISRDQAVIDAKDADPLCHDRLSAAVYTWVRRAGQWMLRHASNCNIPLLIMHGSADALIDPAGSAALAAQVPQCTYQSWEGCYHELHNDLQKDDVIAYLCNWITTHIAAS